MFMYQDKRWAVLCTVHVWLYAADYFFSLYNYSSFIIVSVYVALIFQFTLYPLLDYTLYRIAPVYLLQAYKQTSVDALYTYISFD